MNFFIRIAWALFLIQYQSLGIFIENLAEEKNYSLPWHQKILLIINSCCVTYLVCLAFFYSLSKERFGLEFLVMKAASFIVCILFLTVFFVLRKINKIDYSKILKQQILVLLKYIVCPLICLELIMGSITVPSNTYYMVIAVFLSIVYTFATYCIFKIMLLRFLNFNNHIRDSYKFPFFKKFRQGIAQLSNASHIKQLEPIVQMGFKTILDIESHYIRLYFRECSSIKNLEKENSSEWLHIEQNNRTNFSQLSTIR